MLHASFVQTRRCKVAQKNTSFQYFSVFGTVVAEYDTKTNQNEPAGSKAARIPTQGPKTHSFSLYCTASLFENTPKSNKVLIHCNWLWHFAQCPCRNSVDHAAGKRPNTALALS